MIQGDKKYNSRGNWWYEGAVCEHDGCDHSLDLPEHHEYPAQTNCRIKWCSEHYYEGVRKRTNSRRIHPDTGQRMQDWVCAQAQGHYKALYGSSCSDRKADPKWRECHDKAKADAEAIDWVYPDNVVDFPVNMAVRYDDGSPSKTAGRPRKSPSNRTGRYREGPGWVYIYQDQRIPEDLKIGSSKHAYGRLGNAGTWGLYRCLEQVHFPARYAAEDAVHAILSEYRLYSNKEIFRVDHDTAMKAILQVLHDSTVSKSQGT